MQGIFISYRRQDSQSAAGRLADDLKDALPQATVFRDVETIQPGVDFAEAIERALGACGVLLAVIGPRWLNAADAAGQRRLDKPDDYTRIEIATALKRRDVRVIPILVEGATMPEARDLPEDLKPLARRNALELTDGRWRYDVSRLAETVAQALGMPQPAAADKPRNQTRRVAAIAAAALIVAGLGYSVWEMQAPERSTVAPGASATAAGTAPATDPVSAPATAASAPLPAPAVAPSPAARGTSASAAGPCPQRLSINRALPTPFTCECTAQSVAAGTVWGSDVYTDDSSLCRAAAHAGVVGQSGGTISVLREPGRPLYVGSLRNGVQTHDYGAFSDSLRFAGAQRPAAGPETCPTRLSINRELAMPFRCRCDAAAVQQGTVWGSDVYTDDSSLCRAAAHAGVIGPAGGTITVLREPGRPLYVGSLRNGVQTHDYGAFSDSLRFRSR